MHARDPFGRPRRLLLVTLTILCLTATQAAADDPGSPWLDLGERSREVLVPLMPESRVATRIAAPPSRALPKMIVVGFTGGREGRDSRISGVVGLRRRIEASLDGRGDVVALTFNNRDWREAAGQVLTLAGLDTAAATDVRPLVIAYGHSWGAGAVTKFAREIGDRDLDIALAVYIDAFSLRNPRVPANVHYAVNLYQRTGIFRGFPLRGKSKLVLESPESTTVLANLQITPDTDHFGWHWNLVQPLLYRHHHRMSHDVRLQQYLLDLVAMTPEQDESAGSDDLSYTDGWPSTGSFRDPLPHTSRALEPVF